VLPSLHPRDPSPATTLAALAQLYTAGVDLQWDEIISSPKNYLPGPRYPFERRTHWLEAFERNQLSQLPWKPEQTPIATPGIHPFLQQKLLTAGDFIVYSGSLNSLKQPVLADHGLYDQLVMAGAGFVSMFISAISEHHRMPAMLENLIFSQMLVLDQTQSTTIQLVLTPNSHGQLNNARIASLQPDQTWLTHTTATINTPLPTQPSRIDLQALQNQFRNPDANYQDFYNQVAGFVNLGPSFRWIKTVWRDDHSALGQVSVPLLDNADHDFAVHPGLLDSCVGLLHSIYSAKSAPFELFVPMGIDQCMINQFPTAGAYIHAVLEPPKQWPAETFTGNVQIINPDGTIAIALIGLSMRRMLTADNAPNLKHSGLQHCYRVGWEASSKRDAPSTKPGHWLIIAASSQNIEPLLNSLHAQANTWTLVTLDGSLACGRWPARTINLAEPNLIRDLLATEPQSSPQNVIYLNLAEPVEYDLEQLTTSQTTGVGQLLMLLQGLPDGFELPLWVVTQQTQPINLAEPIVPTNTALWGLGRMARFEMDWLDLRMVDLDHHGLQHGNAEKLLELINSQPTATQLALRNGLTYHPRLMRIDLASTKLSIRAEASYLITGGLGGIGLTLAQHLVDHGAQSLVLVARSAPTSTAREQITALEASGTRITLVQKDLSNPHDVEHIFALIKAELPALRGIFHAAGVLDDGIITHQTWERFEKVMAPKLRGGWLLHSHSTGLDLDYFVLFSSISGLLTGAGQSNYAAANAFLDGLAAFRHAQGLPALSINWGAWDEVGMAKRTQQNNPTVLKNTQGFGWLKPEEALAALDGLLGSNLSNAIVVPLNQNSDQQALFERPIPNQKPAASSQLSISTALNVVELRRIVQQAISHVIGLSGDHQFEPHRPLKELGFDSLSGIELRNYLGKKLGLKLPATLIFDYPTLHELIEYLHGLRNPAELPATATVSAGHSSNLGSSKLPTQATDSMSEQALIDLLDQELNALDAWIEE
ncbi:type I polyketide synthase, partial [Herpetosiphon giganteus]|uniref:type I polyketide synthase n=1 Tax=Herpetosiphon giganteus TaxID=2029754 RepID=UPI00195D1067